MKLSLRQSVACALGILLVLSLCISGALAQRNRTTEPMAVKDPKRAADENLRPLALVRAHAHAPVILSGVDADEVERVSVVRDEVANQALDPLRVHWIYLR